MEAQASLVPGVVPAAIVILFIVVYLFNAMRPPLIIILIIPFIFIGIAPALVATQVPFGFVALLGAMSLSGMMIKNAIVLLDEINAQLAAGKDRYTAVVEAAVSRMRPVGLAARPVEWSIGCAISTSTAFSRPCWESPTAFRI